MKTLGFVMGVDFMIVYEFQVTKFAMERPVHV